MLSYPCPAKRYFPLPSSPLLCRRWRLSLWRTETEALNPDIQAQQRVMLNVTWIRRLKEHLLSNKIGYPSTPPGPFCPLNPQTVGSKVHKYQKWDWYSLEKPAMLKKNYIYCHLETAWSSSGNAYHPMILYKIHHLPTHAALAFSL